MVRLLASNCWGTLQIKYNLMTVPSLRLNMFENAALHHHRFAKDGSTAFLANDAYVHELQCVVLYLGINNN